MNLHTRVKGVVRSLPLPLVVALLLACKAPTPPEPATSASASEPATTATAPASETPPPAAAAQAPAAPPAEVQSPPVPVAEQPRPPPPTTEVKSEPPPAGASDGAPVSIAIYALSKGRGVPEPTREAYGRIRTLLEKQRAASAVSSVSSRRLGLEGETRLCAQFRDREQADAALKEIRQIATDVELLNVVEEPCQDTKGELP
ncbi:hypothetical protein [Lysobacter niastensis]|uniref:SPOR domain-containing protein n=1 Tax=Lysobacter niastensis TaxID=380629 RepID=A0ABS0B5I1_9GAMM|nr:hypothetical protein [Lysobacter niastensis]MBF6024100.1 hypothetical protein [Lysobacter niastensis]